MSCSTSRSLYLLYRYAGPVALLTLVDALPGVGLAPIFTAAAIAYPARPSHATAETHATPVIGQ